jgi:murein DD-endopeptidase MepM/ murein hydrolase activator NlpD
LPSPSSDAIRHGAKCPVQIDTNLETRSRRARAVAALALSALLIAFVPTAEATSGGAGAAPAPTPRPAPTSGPAPVLLDVRCVSNPGGACVESHRAEHGAALRIVGRNLSRASLIVFYGARGPRDDVTSPASSLSDRRAAATVPPGASSGPVAVVDLAGRRSRRWTGLLIEGLQPAFGTFRPAGAPDSVQVAVSEPRTLFYGGPQKAVFSYRALGQRPMDLRVNLVRASDSTTVMAWDRPAVAPGQVNRILWNGGLENRVPREGRYAFVVSTGGGAAVTARAAADAPDESIAVYDHMFPVRGAHDFAGAAGRFGAARTGHTHQGQDVFAVCGTPLVAARGGKVKFSGYHAAAGYYVVIDGKSTGGDYAYMHLRERATVRVGDRVYTGQEIGEVGDTGDAQGCHLHFEEWSAPGWYDGGRPVDPLPDLKRWDRAS